jgi:hypothetical protein
MNKRVDTNNIPLREKTIYFSYQRPSNEKTKQNFEILQIEANLKTF